MSTMGIGLVSCIWGMYGERRNFRYSYHIFVYILWKVRSTMGHELVICPRKVWCCLRLDTHPCYWLHTVEGTEYYGLVSCIWGRYGDLHKVRYSHPTFVYINVEGDEYHRLLSCIWGRYGDLRKISYSPLTFGYILWKVRSTMGGEFHLRKVWFPALKLSTLPFLLVIFCGRWGAPWAMSWWFVQGRCGVV